MQIEREEAIKLLVEGVVRRDYPAGSSYVIEGELSPSKVRVRITPPPPPAETIDINVNWSLIPTGEDPDDYK